VLRHLSTGLYQKSHAWETNRAVESYPLPFDRLPCQTPKLTGLQYWADTLTRVSNPTKTKSNLRENIIPTLKHEINNLKTPGCYILPPLNWISSSKFDLSQ
jgi:hypothetical protein